MSLVCGKLIMHRSQSSVLFLFSLFLLSGPFGAFAASEKPLKTIVFIFDASSSMAQPAGDGATRIDVAKMAMAHVIKQLPKNTDLRLIYFDGECGNVTVFQDANHATGKIQRAMIIKKIESLLPTGSTPLATAIVEAGNLYAREIKGNDRSMDVIVLTDGMDTCGGDPCAVVHELRRQGLAIRIHAIGFMLKNNHMALAALTCVAQASGGGVYSARNADQLLDALKVIQKKIGKGGSSSPSNGSKRGEDSDDENSGFFLKRAR